MNKPVTYKSFGFASIIPILTMLLLAGTLLYMFGNGKSSWTGLTQGKERLEQAKRRVASLKIKSEKLQKIDWAAEKANYLIILSAIPEEKKIWLLTQAANEAATESEASLANYKGLSMGNIRGTAVSTQSGTATYANAAIQANYIVKDIAQAQRVVKSLESKIPLLKINKIRLIEDKLAVDVEIAANYVNEPVLVVDEPLPEYRNLVDMSTSDIQKFTQIKDDADTAYIPTVNPF